MIRGCIVRQGHYPACVRIRKESLALSEKGYEVDVICLKPANRKNREIIDKINVYPICVKHYRSGLLRYLYEYLSFFCLAAFKLCLLHLKKRYDFIQINTLPDFLVFVSFFPKLFGAKVVLDMHEPAPELFSVLFGSEKKAMIRMIKFVEKISMRYADHVITVSKQMKENYLKKGASPKKIDIVLNVPNLEFNPVLYENSINKNNDKFFLICHGAMLKRYGQHIAIKAIDIVKERIPNIQLNILGYGDYEYELKKLTSRLRLKNYVQFYGFIPFLEMIKMISECDIGIVPIEKNAYSDLVHTNKMFELIAMKRPVIISRTKAVENFFGSDDSCLKYFKSGDQKDLARCIIELYNSTEKREKMVHKAYKKFALMHWERTKDDYCKIYERLLSN